MASVKQYAHTQVGWAILVGLVPVFAVLIPVVTVPGAHVLAAVVLALLVVGALLFATLTVRVNEGSIAWHFGIGLIRRSIDLSDVASCTEVVNPWYLGWGIHGFSGGTLYNVSGLKAVELVLRNGRRVRIGSDEPQALLAALRARLPGPASTVERQGLVGTRPRMVRLISVATVVVLIAGVLLLMRVQGRPAAITATSDAIIVESLFYGERYPIGEVRSIELVPYLPRIRMRTNGYALGETLRGRFLLDGLGSGKLFVEVRHPPFILVYTAQTFVGVGYADPNQTKRTFEELRRRFSNLTVDRVND